MIVISRVSGAQMALKMQEFGCTWRGLLPGLFNFLCFKNDDEVNWKNRETAARTQFKYE